MNNKDLADFCDQLITANAYRNEMWRAIDRMTDLEYDLPEAFAKIPGHHKVTRPDPYVDVLTATNALAATEPEIKIDPMANKLADKKVANERERWLRWQLRKLDNRSGGSVISKIIESAFKYHAVTFSTRHVDYAKRAKEEMTGRRRAMRRAHSPFAWTYYNPQDVYWQSSEDGLERVLAVSVEPLQTVLDEYGKKAASLEKKLRAQAKTEAPFKWVTKFCYYDYEVFKIWVVPTSTTSPAKPSASDAVWLMDEKNDLGFIPFVCEEQVSTSVRDKHKPLLYATYKSRWWETQNALETIGMTQTIINGAEPGWIEETPSGESKVVYEYEHVAGGVAIVPPGHKLQKVARTQLDSAIITQAERLSNWQAQSGAARALTGGIGDEAFAASSLKLTVGGATIAPGNKLARRAIAEGLFQILAWTTIAEKETVYVMGDEKDMPEEGWGVSPNEIDLASVYIEVTLRQDNPLGKLQAANAGAIMKQFGVSDESIMEDIGISDPQGEMKRRAIEELSQAMLRQTIKQIDAATDMQLQQQMMAMQQQATQPPPMPDGAMGTNEIYSNPTPMNAMPPTGIPEGPGFNSNGAMAPAMVAPTVTRETQTGLM